MFHFFGFYHIDKHAVCTINQKPILPTQQKDLVMIDQRSRGFTHGNVALPRLVLVPMTPVIGFNVKLPYNTRDLPMTHTAH